VRRPTPRRRAQSTPRLKAAARANSIFFRAEQLPRSGSLRGCGPMPPSPPAFRWHPMIRSRWSPLPSCPSGSPPARRGRAGRAEYAAPRRRAEPRFDPVSVRPGPQRAAPAVTASVRVSDHESSGRAAQAQAGDQAMISVTPGPAAGFGSPAVNFSQCTRLRVGCRFRCQAPAPGDPTLHRAPRSVTDCLWSPWSGSGLPTKLLTEWGGA
jgi:hypothetical protein